MTRGGAVASQRVVMPGRSAGHPRTSPTPDIRRYEWRGHTGAMTRSEGANREGGRPHEALPVRVPRPDWGHIFDMPKARSGNPLRTDPRASTDQIKTRRVRRTLAIPCAPGYKPCVSSKQQP